MGEPPMPLAHTLVYRRHEQVDRSGILHGIQLHAAHLSEAWSLEPVAALRKPPVLVTRGLTSQIYATSTADATESRLLAWGFDKESVISAARWPGIRNETDCRLGANRPYEFVTAAQQYPGLVVRTNLGDLVPHQCFVDEVDDAVHRDTVGERNKALQAVLARWGQIIPTMVTLGSAIGTTVDVPSTRSVRPP